jgi:hypothetical protein
VNSVVAALLAAGWTNISGSGTDRVLGSGTTPDNLKAKVRIWDPGSGNCARVALRNWNETLTGDNSPAFCQPGLTYKIVASAYQFVVWVPGSTAARTMILCTIPKLEPALSSVITNAAYMEGNAAGDTDTTVRPTIRTRLKSDGAVANSLLNGSLYVGFHGLEKALHVRTQCGPSWGTSGYTWHDGSVDVMECRVKFEPIAQAQWLGYLWDAMLVYASFAPDIPLTWDGKNWVTFTANNTDSSYFGTVCLRV